MLSPSVFPDLKPFYLFEILRKRIAGELLAPLINLLFWRFVMLWAVGRNPEQRAALADFHAPFRGRGGGWRLMSLLRWGDPADVLAQIPEFLPRVMVPALILHGSRDPAVPEEFARRASGMLANSEVVVLNTGHFLPMNEPARIARELLCFFEKHGDWASCLVSGAAGVTDGR
jgi:pimeloyl-ACP methyl ester carboxylesterase